MAAAPTIADVREKIKDFKPKVKTLRSMSELKLVNPYTIDMGDGKTIPMERTAIKGLCNELEMPKSFYGRLFARNKQAWQTLTKTLAEQHRKPISLIRAKDRVIAIVSKLSDITKHDEMLSMASIVLKDKSFHLKSFGFNGVDLVLHIAHDMEFEAGKWANQPDFFKRGVVLSNSITDGFEGSSLIERIICGNLAYAEIPGTSKNISDVEKIPDFVFGQSLNEIIDLIKRSVEKLKHNNASLQELLNVHRLFARSMDTESAASQYMKQYASELRIGEIAHKYYNMNLERLAEAPTIWCSTARTPFILFDLYNWITYIAAHDKRLLQSEITDFRIKGGDMLFDHPDLASIAPEIEIPKHRWMLSEN